MTIFDNDRHGRVVVRASGTKPGMRLYLGTDPPTTERISAAGIRSANTERRSSHDG
ncbi:hypothetical protein ACFQYP_18830 [Nonomuraea antimicrobica]|uniref:hypothetical protein n=1 Tax=Nonomuraea antimicrobica TaxID=561173 RepID=UPI0031EE17A1